MRIKNEFLFLVGILIGVILFSGCGKLNKDTGKSLNQEQVINSSNQTATPLVKSPLPTSGVNENKNLATPDPGDSAAGKAVKEVDALLEGVSVEDYNASSLDEKDLLAE